MHLKFHGTVKNIFPLTYIWLYHCYKRWWNSMEIGIVWKYQRKWYYHCILLLQPQENITHLPWRCENPGRVLAGKHKPGQKVPAKAALQDKMLGVLQGRHEKLKDKMGCIKTVNLLLGPTHRQNSIFPALPSILLRFK